MSDQRIMNALLTAIGAENDAAVSQAERIIEELNNAGFAIVAGIQLQAYERAAKALPNLLLHSEHEEGEVRREAYAAIWDLKEAGVWSMNARTNGQIANLRLAAQRLEASGEISEAMVRLRDDLRVEKQAIEGYRTENASLRARITEQDAEIERLAAQVNAMRSRAGDAVMALGRLMEEDPPKMQEMERENTRLRARIAELEQELQQKIIANGELALIAIDHRDTAHKSSVRIAALEEALTKIEAESIDYAAVRDARAALTKGETPETDGNELGRLWDAIVKNTQGDLFWIGEILLAELEKETGFSKRASGTPEREG